MNKIYFKNYSKKWVALCIGEKILDDMDFVDLVFLKWAYEKNVFNREEVRNLEDSLYAIGISHPIIYKIAEYDGKYLRQFDKFEKKYHGFHNIDENVYKWVCYEDIDMTRIQVENLYIERFNRHKANGYIIEMKKKLEKNNIEYEYQFLGDGEMLVFKKPLAIGKDSLPIKKIGYFKQRYYMEWFQFLTLKSSYYFENEWEGIWQKNKDLKWNYFTFPNKDKDIDKHSQNSQDKAHTGDLI